MSSEVKTRWSYHLLGLLLAAVYLVLLLATARDIGFARDEGFYFDAARAYQRWFDILLEDPGRAAESHVIASYWKQNSEHPALMKVLFGFSNRVFDLKLGWLSPSTSFRLPGMVFAALCVYLLFLWGSVAFGPRAGFAAAAFFALMPRVFYHAHLACFDVAITFMWLLVSYLYWRSLRSWKLGIAAGAAFGLALGTKLNAFFIPFVLAVHYAILLAIRLRRKERPPSPFAFVFGLVLAPPIFFGHWPWLWYDTVNRFIKYLGFHSAHPHYNTAWFGENIVQAPTPAAFPLVMTLITVPTVIVAMCAAGWLIRLGHHLPPRFKLLAPDAPLPDPPDGLDLLLLISTLFPIVLISLPWVPVFGGTKHWMPAFPFVALVAGAAASHLAGLVAKRLRRLPERAVAGAVLALLLTPPLQQTVTSHPFGLASYVPLIGGAPGAATLGMTRQFWGYTTAGVIGWLNDHFPDGAGVDFHDTAMPAVRMYHEEGMLNRDIRPAHLKNTTAALMHHELHMVRNEAWIWNRYRTFAPAHVLTYQGVPIVSVYVRPRGKLGP